MYAFLGIQKLEGLTNINRKTLNWDGVMSFFPTVKLHSCCIHAGVELYPCICMCVIEVKTHGFPPEEPGREEGNPGALR